MIFNLFSRKKKSFDKNTWEREFNFISRACQLGIVKMDNPFACSGVFVYNDGSSINTKDPELQNFLEKYGPDWTMEQWKTYKNGRLV